MLCSNVQGVVDGVATREVVDGPVPVNPIVVVELTGVEYGGMMVVCDGEDELGRLALPVGLVVDVESEGVPDESEVAKPLLRLVDEAALPVPVGLAEEVEFEAG